MSFPTRTTGHTLSLAWAHTSIASPSPGHPHLLPELLWQPPHWASSGSLYLTLHILTRWSFLSNLSGPHCPNSEIMHPAPVQGSSEDTPLPRPVPSLTPLSSPTFYLPSTFSLLSLCLEDHSPHQPLSLNYLLLLARHILTSPPLVPAPQDCVGTLPSVLSWPLSLA